MFCKVLKSSGFLILYNTRCVVHWTINLDQLERVAPGFGGVERVAHELAHVWGGIAFSFDVQGQSYLGEDPLPVHYPRRRVPSFRLFGRLQLPLPSRVLWQLLRSSSALHGHLPSPGVLFVLILARLIDPRRPVTAHWHCWRPAKVLTAFFCGLSMDCFASVAQTYCGRYR